MKKALIVLAVLLLLAAGGAGFWIWPHLQTSASGPEAEVSWTYGGTPRIAEVLVFDEHDHPLQGVFIEFEYGDSGSGTNSDYEGRAEIKLEESVFHTVRVNGAIVLHRPRAAMIGVPSAADGLRMKIRIKKPEAFSIYLDR
ncbi:MAG: hypothetical protein HS116_13435 [Planctomycetes bacterium]|nr:hypothetical protein [Planctomycetota bacterium]